MPKKSEAKQEAENQALLDEYKKQAERLYFLSKFNVRQFLGTREEGDTRVSYMAGLEGFKNLANAQLAGIIRILTMMLGDKKGEFHKIMAEELGTQVKSMEDDVGITGWTEDGQPQFDLNVLREKTKGWPQ